MKRSHLGTLLFTAIAVSTTPMRAAEMELPWLTGAEQKEAAFRLKAFLERPGDPSAMNLPSSKFSPGEHRFVKPNRELISDEGTDHPLHRLAQEKGTREFWNHHCETFLKKIDPATDCSSPDAEPLTWEAPQPGETLPRLTRTWLADYQLTNSLDQIPVSGATRLSLWSGSYWRYRWGAVAWRYAGTRSFPGYAEARAAYEQPAEWNQLLHNLRFGYTGSRDAEITIARWSPAEKYDIAVGDTSFSLRNQQWTRAEELLKGGADLPDWYGLCDGWAAASIMQPVPRTASSGVGANGIRVWFYPEDLKGIVSLAWTRGAFASDGIGGRCSAMNPETYPNGRLKDPKCFDVTPSVFHLALGNVIGRHGLSFIADKTFDIEVWNHPIQSYRLTYFNPLDYTQVSDDWKTVSVSYDEAFKARDRFQKPLTRGVRLSNGSYHDKGIQRVVGVAVTVEYVSPTQPVQRLTEGENRTIRETLHYDLEIARRGSQWVPVGGEWYSNSRPDFLWIPQRGTYPHAPVMERHLFYSGDYPPPLSVTASAQAASRQGVPLCTVTQELLRRGGAPSQAYCR